MKKDIREILLEKEVKEYLRDNAFDSLVKDVSDLTSMVQMFKLKYGIDLDITFNK
jgi:hypothetical protein